MTNKIVEELAKDKTVETIIKNVAKQQAKDEDLKDLAQDIYIELLTMDGDKLKSIYEKGQIKYFISRIVINNIKSITSRYYYIYKKNKKDITNIEKINETDIGYFTN